MSLNTCPKCLKSPCICGYQYKDYTEDELIKLISNTLKFHNKEKIMERLKNEMYENYLIAVKNDGLQLKNIKNQTHNICLTAVLQNGLALEFSNIKTLDILICAVKNNGNSLQFINDQTDYLCMEAVMKNNESIVFVKDKEVKEMIKRTLNL